MVRGMRRGVLFTIMLLSLGCRGGETARGSEGDGRGILEKARVAGSCDELVKVYEDREDEALEIWRGLRSGEVEAQEGLPECGGAALDKDSCGCPLSSGDCASFFFGCFGGDARSCCWFDSCYDRKNVSKCDSYCDECSSWGGAPVGGSGVGEDDGE
jgi:hypothetical protein